MNAIHPGLGCAVGDVTYEDALQRLLGLAPVPLPCRLVETAACSGRVLAEAVVARRGLPGFDQSAMDGYAVLAADAAKEQFLPLIGWTTAGEAAGRLVRPGGAYRVFTGAPIPSGADCVVVQEDAHVIKGNLVVNAAPPSSANIRRRAKTFEPETF